MGQSRQIGDVRDESGSPPIAPALANRSNDGLGHNRKNRSPSKSKRKRCSFHLELLSGMCRRPLALAQR
jgi:hypothetical protein